MASVSKRRSTKRRYGTTLKDVLDFQWDRVGLAYPTRLARWHDARTYVVRYPGRFVFTLQDEHQLRLQGRAAECAQQSDDANE